MRRRWLNHYPLDLIERDLVVGSIVKFGRTWAFMRGHGLRVFKGTTGFKIGGEASSAKGVAAELGLEAGLCRAATDHPIGVDPVHRALS